MIPDPINPKPHSSFDEPVDIPLADPDDTPLWCVQFSEDYLPVVMGALLAMIRPDTWKYTTPEELHAAQDKGNTLIKLFQEGTDCMGGILLDLCDDPYCGIKYSTDGGDTWTCINLGSCIYDIAGTRIEDAIQDGTLQKGGQSQGGEERPPMGECHTYHLTVDAKGQAVLPQTIKALDTVHVTNITGGWCDGTLAWYCGDGKRYLFGQCMTEGQHHEAGDVFNPGAYHMALVAKYGTTYFDPATLYTVPAETSEQNLIFQANDGTLSDNSGELSFDVEVCSGVVAGCYEFDFTTGKHGWDIGVDPQLHYDVGYYEEGKGFRSEYMGPGNPYGLSIVSTSTMFRNLTWTAIEYDFYVSGTALNVLYWWAYQENAGLNYGNFGNVLDFKTCYSGYSSTWPDADYVWRYLFEHLQDFTLRKIRFTGCDRQPGSSEDCP